MKCRKCRAGELICRGVFFSFQFAYHLLHLPLLTPEGLRGDFDLNRKSRVVWVKISSSLCSEGKTLEPCLDSETGFTSGSGSQGSWWVERGPKCSWNPTAQCCRGQTEVETPRTDSSTEHWWSSIIKNTVWEKYKMMDGLKPPVLSLDSTTVLNLVFTNHYCAVWCFERPQCLLWNYGWS